MSRQLEMDRAYGQDFVGGSEFKFDLETSEQESKQTKTQAM
jgi:hypothetical protein